MLLMVCHSIKEKTTSVWKFFGFCAGTWTFCIVDQCTVPRSFSLPSPNFFSVLNSHLCPLLQHLPLSFLLHILVYLSISSTLNTCLITFAYFLFLSSSIYTSPLNQAKLSNITFSFRNHLQIFYYILYPPYSNNVISFITVSFTCSSCFFVITHCVQILKFFYFFCSSP